MEQREPLELHGTVEEIHFHNDENQYTVLQMLAGEDLHTVVGYFPFISEGEELGVTGRWEENATYGRQFRAETFTRAQPSTERGMLKYLSSGAVKGVGKVTALRIIETFGVDALRVIEQEPERLAQVKGITAAKAQEISEELQRIYGIREVMTWLGAFGVPPEQAALVWKRYGDETVYLVQEDPYLLCDESIGVSFQIADAISQSMEFPIDHETRIEAGLLHVLRHNLLNGHTCLPQEPLCRTAAGLLGVGVDLVQDGLETLCGEFQLMREEDGGRPLLFLQQQHHYETYIAAHMRAMLRAPARALAGADEKIGAIEAAEGIQYAGKQRAAIRAAMEQGVLILTGGPGTGKTTTLNAIIRILKEAGERVLLAAPTGRAAKRMSSLTGEEAKTIHRMLEVTWDERDNPIFNRNEENPLACECLVIDEMSMVDTYVFCSLLRALPLGCRLILVGDTDQLPSVGPGNVLGDLIASGLFPTVELTEVFRQALQSLIITGAHKIVAGEMPDITRKDSDFFFFHRREVGEAQALVQSLLGSRLPNAYGYDPLEDIQVLCPSRKGEMGTVELNHLLREAVNPPAEGKPEVKLGGGLFRLGDKVMQVKNDYDLPWTRDDGTEGQGVFNGDMGVITAIDKVGQIIEVRMEDRLLAYGYDQAATELEPAFAVTVHKSQGNEFTAVILPVLKVPRPLCYRNLLYTAVTRAKKLLILVGEPAVLQEMIADNRKPRRYTGLGLFLSKEQE